MSIAYFIKNAAYSGTDFMLFSNPKFLDEILIAYLGLYLFIYTFKLLLDILLSAFTSIGIIPSSLYIIKSISA